MKKPKEIYNVVLLMGITIYSLFYIYDFLLFPELRWLSFIVRVIVVSVTIYLRKFMLRTKDEMKAFWATAFSLFLAAVGISFLCVITGDKISAYTGLFLVMFAYSAFVYIPLRQYVIVIVSVVIQHFIFLLFHSPTLKDLTMGIFYCGAFIAMSIFIHRFIYNLLTEIKILKGFLPICAKCKKIRGDDGYWSELEGYIKENSEAEFTHGLCPHCVTGVLQEIKDFEKDQQVDQC